MQVQKVAIKKRLDRLLDALNDPTSAVHKFLRSSGVGGRFEANVEALSPEGHVYFRIPFPADPGAANAIDRAAIEHIAKLLRSGKGIDYGASAKVWVVEGSKRTDFVFKPVDGRVEDLAYKAMELFGMPTPRRCADEKFILLEWINAKEKPVEEDFVANETVIGQVGKICGISALIGNSDMIYENMLLRGEEVVPIDPECSFKTRLELQELLWVQMEFVIFHSLIYPFRLELENRKELYRNDPHLARNIGLMAESIGEILDRVAADANLRNELRKLIGQSVGKYARVILNDTIHYSGIPELAERRLVPHYSEEIRREDADKLIGWLEEIARKGPEAGWKGRMDEILAKQFVALPFAEMLRVMGGYLMLMENSSVVPLALLPPMSDADRARFAREALEEDMRQLRELGLNAPGEQMLALARLLWEETQQKKYHMAKLLSNEALQICPKLAEAFEHRRQLLAYMRQHDVSELEAERVLAFEPKFATYGGCELDR